MKIVADHDDAVAVAADQELHRLDRALAWRRIAATGRDHHMAMHRAQFSIGLLEDRAVIRAEKRRHEKTDHAERLRRHRAPDRRRTEIQLFDCRLHARGSLGRHGAFAGNRPRCRRHADPGQGCDVFQGCHEFSVGRYAFECRL